MGELDPIRIARTAPSPSPCFQFTAAHDSPPITLLANHFESVEQAFATFRCEVEVRPSQSTCGLASPLRPLESCEPSPPSHPRKSLHPSPNSLAERLSRSLQTSSAAASAPPKTTPARQFQKAVDTTTTDSGGQRCADRSCIPLPTSTCRPPSDNHQAISDDENPYLYAL